MESTNIKMGEWLYMKNKKNNISYMILIIIIFILVVYLMLNPDLYHDIFLKIIDIITCVTLKFIKE